MSDIPIEKRFKALVEITRAQHFAWREAVKQLFPEARTEDVVYRMWEVTGRETAQAYLKRLDRARPLAPQVAAAIVWSSVSMGEDAHLEESAGGREAFVRHDGCPWFAWHKRLGLLAEDRPGCDRWFEAMVAELNEKLEAKLRFETLAALPDGADVCRRRFWEE